MKVRLYPSDKTGCGFYRMSEPARVASEHVEIEMCWHPEEEGGLEVKLAGRLGSERVVQVDHPGVDVVVFQRPAHKHLVESIPFIQAHGVAVVCDYDDDFDCIDPRNPAWRAYDPASSPMSNKVWAKLGSELADLVTVTTNGLGKKYGSHGRFLVLPNCVPESYLTVEPTWPNPLPTNYPRIGWAGNPDTHPGDLEVMGDALVHLWNEKRILFRTLGSRKTERIVAAPTEVVEWAPIEEFASLVASFDIGVVPLKDSTFNKSKSWLKGLEYAALGVPFVASPTRPYRDLSQLGAGDLVNTTTRSTSAWQRALSRLVEDEEYRRLRAEEGRIVAKAWTYEERALHWVQAWADALSIRKAR